MLVSINNRILIFTIECMDFFTFEYILLFRKLIDSSNMVPFLKQWQVPFSPFQPNYNWNINIYVSHVVDLFTKLKT